MFHQKLSKLSSAEQHLVNRARACADAGHRSVRFRRKSTAKLPPKVVVNDPDMVGHLVLTAYVVGVSGNVPTPMIQSKPEKPKKFFGWIGNSLSMLKKRKITICLASLFLSPTFFCPPIF